MGIVWDTIIRAFIAFALIMVITKVLGKHTIARMTYYDFVASITLGAITGNIAFNTSMKTWHLAVSFLSFSGIAYIVAFISLKSRKIRKWLAGKPTVVIENGKILEQNLKKIQITLDTLNQELREKDIFDPEEVEYAVLELNGKLSVLKKPQYRALMRKDFNLPSPAQSQFPIELIMDGQIIKNNLELSGVSTAWLSKQLQLRGVTAEQVSYAVMRPNGKLFCDLYWDNIRHPIDQE
ncbi:DUF421 domain-containing protein [Paenibacillus cremeus]|uniref:DUF421 domain-containing protein n=1 Tax=Paenibacillus cremeus TaxID=2163881 RepID=A0A559K6L0_9BACL|nr:DUF421 domain-containing protein [Paenibacillus cremeus]TVY07761.1 DUF421 domain-containing protein [Paenibacillus cremeus]